MERGVPGCFTAVSGPPAPRLFWELPHRGALCAAAAPSPGVTATRAAAGPDAPVGRGRAAKTPDHAPGDTVGTEAARTTHRHRYAVPRPPPSPASRCGDGRR